MTEQQNISQSAFEAICFAMTNLKWDYSRNSSGLQVESRIWGNDIPMDIVVAVDAENAMIKVRSELPFEVKENENINISLAVSMINVNLEYGSFKYSSAEKKVWFAINYRFIGCEMSISVFEQILQYAVEMIDDYNDKLLLLSDSLMSLDEFSVFLTELIEQQHNGEEADTKQISLEKTEEVFNQIDNVVALKTAKYTTDMENLSVSFTLVGEDLPMDITVKADRKHEILKVSSPMPYKISVDNRVTCAMGVCAVSAKMTAGNFDYDIINGIITFRLTMPFKDCVITSDVIEDMIVYAEKVTDDYNDRFLALDKGFLKLDSLING